MLKAIENSLILIFDLSFHHDKQAENTISHSHEDQDDDS